MSEGWATVFIIAWVLQSVATLLAFREIALHIEELRVHLGLTALVSK